MKSLRILAIAAVALAIFAVDAEAQKKATRKTSTRKPTTANKVIAPLDVRAAREKVQTQKDNVTFYIQQLGPIASALETLEPAYVEKRLSRGNQAKHEQRKSSFVTTVRNIRQELVVLEAEFRTKGALERYSTSLSGIADIAAASEDLAIAAKFVEANARLREVEKKLVDALMMLPR